MMFKEHTKKALFAVLISLVTLLGGVALLANVNEKITEGMVPVKEQYRLEKETETTQTPPTQEIEANPETDFTPIN